MVGKANKIMLHTTFTNYVKYINLRKLKSSIYNLIFEWHSFAHEKHNIHLLMKKVEYIYFFFLRGTIKTIHTFHSILLLPCHPTLVEYILWFSARLWELLPHYQWYSDRCFSRLSLAVLYKKKYSKIVCSFMTHRIHFNFMMLKSVIWLHN